MKTALFCGISGQDGTYLARLLLNKGYKVHGTARDAQMFGFYNLRLLGISDQVTFHSMALNDFRSVLQILTKVEPDEIYNLAGQSSVGLSFDQPVETLESISVGTLNLLEAIRFLDRPFKLYNAGSSECFGNTDGHSADENRHFALAAPMLWPKQLLSGKFPTIAKRIIFLPVPVSSLIMNLHFALSASLPRKLSSRLEELQVVVKKSFTWVIYCKGLGVGPGIC